MQPLRAWFVRYASNRQLVLLSALLLLIVAAFAFFGSMLAPVLAAIVIAYLLEGLVSPLSRLGLPRIVAVWLVFIGFMAVLLAAVFALLPVLLRQLAQLVEQVPAIAAETHRLMMQLPDIYLDFVSEREITLFVNTLRNELLRIGQLLLSYSLSSILGLIALVVYLVLVPFLVFFFIKDKDQILDWIGGQLPAERPLVTEIWVEVKEQIGNYVRGKVLETVIVAAVSFVVFDFFELPFALLLSVATGLSVIIPFVGAVAVTIPVAIVAYLAWGLSAEMASVLLAYAVLQTLDGYVLNPLLMSKAVNLHPVAIIVAILVFGGLWGFWGVFFAIPLATVVQSVLGGWQRASRAGLAKGPRRAPPGHAGDAGAGAPCEPRRV